MNAESVLFCRPKVNACVVFIIEHIEKSYQKVPNYWTIMFIHSSERQQKAVAKFYRKL